VYHAFIYICIYDMGIYVYMYIVPAFEECVLGEKDRCCHTFHRTPGVCVHVCMCACVHVCMCMCVDV